jgi:hypothetical protein
VKRSAWIAALAASLSLVGAGWFTAASLAGKAEVGATVPVPGSSVFTDATGEDPSALAPDIQGVSVSNSASDEVTFRVEITNFSTPDNGLRIDVYLDVDTSDATGAGDGADFALSLAGADYPDAGPRLRQWDAGGWQEVASTIQATYDTVPPYDAEITVKRAEIANTTGFDFVTTTEVNTASDRAPNSGEWVYPLTFPETTSTDTTTTTTPTTTTTDTTTTITTTTTTTTTTPAPTTTVTTTTTTPPPPATTVYVTTSTQSTTTVLATTHTETTLTIPSTAPDACPNIRGKQAKVPRGMVKRNGKCVRPASSGVSLGASALIARPSRPTAGRQFAVGATIFDRKTRKRLPSGAVSCPAVVAGEPLAVRRTFFDSRHSAAYCYWMIPASARGKVLQGAVVAKYRGASVRRSFSARVR